MFNKYDGRTRIKKKSGSEWGQLEGCERGSETSGFIKWGGGAGIFLLAEELSCFPEEFCCMTLFISLVTEITLWGYSRCSTLAALGLSISL